MVIQQAITKHLRINEDETCRLVYDNNIEYINFVLKCDYIGSTYIYAIPVSSESAAKTRCFKIIRNKFGYKVRTPSCLLKYRGKKIVLYQDNLRTNVDELFRIQPIDFSFDKSGRRLVFDKFPYFTNGGGIVIPTYYINEYLDEYAGLMRVSFDRISEAILDGGEIHALLSINKDSRSLNYPLYQCSKGLRTKTLVKLIDFTNSSGKFIENFKYENTYKDKYNKYGLIVFKEVFNG